MLKNNALATDAQGHPVVVTTRRIEHGINDRAGQWAVVRVDRTFTQDGDVVTVRRTIERWMTSRPEFTASSAARGLDL